ncbi:MAG: hypothetical protein ACE5GV_02750 [Candidatus Scalindua sp.]
MLKYFIIFAFILCLIQAHALCATEANSNNSIEDIEDQKKIESETGKWTGIDVSIVGKYAEKYGHPPKDPYINTDQGDLLLFVFTFFGLIGGIIIGYNFRKLFVEGKDKRNSEEKEI